MIDPKVELERARELFHVLMSRRGEADSFRWLVDRYEKKLLYFIRRIVDNSDRALDVLQEVWLTVFRQIAVLKTPEAFRVWVYRIAHDKAIDQVRGDRRYRDLAGLSFDDASCDTSDDSCEGTRLEDAEWIHQLLHELTPAHREVLTLRFLEEMSLEEISTVLGCSVGTVKSRLHNARRRIQKRILEDKHV